MIQVIHSGKGFELNFLKNFSLVDFWISRIQQLLNLIKILQDVRFNSINFEAQVKLRSFLVIVDNLISVVQLDLISAKPGLSKMGGPNISYGLIHQIILTHLSLCIHI